MGTRAQSPTRPRPLHSVATRPDRGRLGASSDRRRRARGRAAAAGAARATFSPIFTRGAAARPLRERGYHTTQRPVSRRAAAIPSRRGRRRKQLLENPADQPSGVDNMLPAQNIKYHQTSEPIWKLRVAEHCEALSLSRKPEVKQAARRAVSRRNISSKRRTSRRHVKLPGKAYRGNIQMNTPTTSDWLFQPDPGH